MIYITKMGIYRNTARTQERIPMNSKQFPQPSTRGPLGLKHWQVIAVYLMIYDLLVCAGSYFMALWLRFDGHFSGIPKEYFMPWLKFAPIYAVFCLIVFNLMRLYRSMWQFASYNELIRTTIANGITAVFHIVFITIFLKRMPISYYMIGAVLQFVLVLAIRFSYRFVLLFLRRSSDTGHSANSGRVMLIGAGSAGQMILRDMHKVANGDRVCCIIDDNRNKWGRYMDGIPIVGGRKDITHNVEKYKIDKIYLAIPSASAAQRRDILNICKETNCELKNLPGMYQFVAGTITASALQTVDVEDLLGRESVKVNMSEIFYLLNQKVVLVTGGGGSIGSELCRQIAKTSPKQLVIFDIYENNAHAIELELRDQFPDLNLVVLIGSVRDSRRIGQVFAKYKPDITFHAAAHKHVPLMETSPCETIKNNVIGTYNTALAAMHNGCKRFVLISTDKAVNPTNIMGASKRLCEMVIQSFDRLIREGRAAELAPIRSHKNAQPQPAMGTPVTEFVAVRFGNVLGSNGSVIPRFKEQIQKGGPVTVTHPEIIRYFMTIPEATSLVLQAGAYANGGEIFVLDMGSPVKIDTLARNLIRLSGLRPDIDIPIVYTGLRPGEKLYEEKLMSEEGLQTTPNQLIHIGHPIAFDTDYFLSQLGTLMEYAYEGEDEHVRRLVAELVTTFRDAEEVNSQAIPV